MNNQSADHAMSCGMRNLLDAQQGSRVTIELRGIKIIRYQGWMFTRQFHYAKALFEQAHQQGHAAASYQLAQLLEQGISGEQSSAKALDYYRQAAMAGLPAAQHRLGELYRDGEYLPYSPQDAAIWFQRAANQGHADAQYQLGRLHEHGLLAGARRAQAIEWFQLAATQGHIAALFDLAWLLSHSPECRQDLASALYWYAKAAGKDRQALCNLADLLLTRICFLREEETIEWLTQAGLRGHTGARIYLADYYCQAERSPANLLQAYLWLGMLVDSGHCELAGNYAAVCGELYAIGVNPAVPV